MTDVTKNIEVDLTSAINKYQLKRSETYSNVIRSLRGEDEEQFAHIKISEMREHVFDAYRSWDHSQRRVSWRWEEERETARMKRPSYWEMAIWHRQTLCGLVLGKPSQKRSRLYIEGIEGNPSGHPFKGLIIPIALIASEMYAHSIGCKEVWLVEPHEDLLDRYQQAGYNLMLRHKLIKKVFGAKSFATKTL